MSETKKPFNLLKFVYAKLFSQQCLCLNAQSCIFEQTSKIYSWTSVLCWLKKQGYVYDFKIKNVDEDKSVLAYKFNRQKLMYEPYLKAIERNLKKDSLAIEPMGDLIEKKAVDDFKLFLYYEKRWIRRGVYEKQSDFSCAFVARCGINVCAFRLQQGEIKQ